MLFLKNSFLKVNFKPFVNKIVISDTWNFVLKENVLKMSTNISYLIIKCLRCHLSKAITSCLNRLISWIFCLYSSSNTPHSS